jgi:hypothetical protein
VVAAKGDLLVLEIVIRIARPDCADRRFHLYPDELLVIVDIE